MDQYILSIDQGTTGTTVSLFNASGERLEEASLDFRQIFPKPGWVEHDPEDIWGSVRTATRALLEKTAVRGSQIAGIGITNQRETVIVWDRKTGKPVYNAIVWQCRRTTHFCKKLKPKEKTIRKKTGLVVDPYFSASKVRWILDHVPGAKARARGGGLAMGTIDTFLLWRLTRGRVHGTDVSNASRTQLMNITTGEWDRDLLKIFGRPAELLPEIHPNSGVLGSTRGLDFLPDGIPVAGMAGDQQAALFGQGCFEAGAAKCTYGTGSFLLINGGPKPKFASSGALTTIAWKLGPRAPLIYALEGSAFVSGAAVQWLRDGLQIIKSSAEVEELALTVEDTGGVEFVPAFTGLGAPHWRPEARAVISGLTRGSHRGHIARACLEGIALQNCDLLAAMERDLGKRVKVLKVDGGAAADNLLMQIQADYSGVRLIRPQMLETTSAGAAYLAGLGVGFWSDVKDIQRVWKMDRDFRPQMGAGARKKRMERWRAALATA
jgi:glycerol kinase